MDVRLVVIEGPARTREVWLRAAETIIGRSRDCDICIPAANVSRRHCLLSREGGHVMVEDLSSANGTYLNNELIAGKLQINPGDRLQIGPLTFRMETSAQPPPPADSEPAEVLPEDGAEDDTHFELAEVEEESGLKPEDDEIVDLVPEDCEPLKIPEGEDLRKFLDRLDK